MKSSYDPNIAPHAQAWLELDEGERIELAAAHHRRSECEHPLSPNPRLHAVIHTFVENQIALGNETPVAATVERLVREGLTRHDAIHAIGSLLAPRLYRLLEEGAEDFNEEDYHTALRNLDAQSWRSSQSESDDPSDAPSMDVEEIIRALHMLPPDFPREALDAAQLKPEGIVEGLVAILNATRARMLAGDEPADVAHLYALFLLGTYEEASAFDTVAHFCALDEEHIDFLLGDFVHEDLPRIFASLCGDDTQRLERIVESDSYVEYVRAAALRAFVALVQRRVLPREKVAVYFEELMRKRLRRVPSAVWRELACSILDLHVTELFDDVRRRIEDELVDGTMISAADVTAAQNETLEVAMRRLDEDHHLAPVRHVAEEVEWWHCFQEEASDDEEWDDDEADDWGRDDDERQVPFMRATAKVGRNDPCPCGSGKKYKKCCLGRG